MNTHADKTQEHKSISVSRSESQVQSRSGSTFQFIDNRPEAVIQRKLQEMANSSPQAENASGQFQQPLQKKENKTGLPDTLKSGIENLSGYSMDDVNVHYNSDKPAQLQAHAYAQGSDIHLASGQEKHLPHEAWHVVQQKQGRVQPTVQMKGKVNVNDDAGLEKEADLMGSKAMQMKTTTASLTKKEGKEQVVQRVKGKNRGKKQKKKGRQRGEPLPGRGKRRRQEQDSDLSAFAAKIEAVGKRQESYDAHDERLETSKRNQESQAQKHESNKAGNAEIVFKKTVCSNMEQELSGVIDSTKEKAKLYAHVGSSQWSKNNKEERETWYDEARPIRMSFVDYNFGQLTADLNNLSNRNPWKDNDLDAFNSEFDAAVDSFDEAKIIARSFLDKLQEAEDKIEAFEPPDRGSSAARKPKELKKEYAFGAANSIPHIHTYGERFHLKIVDPDRPGEPVRLNLVTENGYQQGNMTDAIRIARGRTGSDSLVNLLTQIKDYLE